MKKSIYFLILFVFVLSLFSCSNENVYKVTFDSNGGTKVTSQKIKIGCFVTIPEKPVQAGYIFLYWTLDDEQYDFNTPVTKNITLVAKWEEELVHSHIYNEKVIEPTCESEGYTIYTCDCVYFPSNIL